MASQTITPVASTSTAPDNAFTHVKDDSTEKQRINIKKQKDEEINYNLATWWLRMVEPRRAPYFPQRKDKIVYLRHAHEYYLKEIINHKIFDVQESDKLWVQMNILDYEYLTVTNVNFKRYPTRVARLEVRKCIKETEDTNEPVFELKYHDMEGVVDFLVLKHIFDEGLVMEWNVGDPFRYLIDNMWFSGTIVSIKPHYQKSPFKSFQIKWDDEEELDQISPWEIQRINKTRLPKNHGESVEILNIEIVKMRYEPCPDDWPNWEDWKATIKDIIPEFDLLIDLPISKCFIEIKNDPIYDALVPYPVDLSMIRERIHNHFYRRIDTLLLDLSYLIENAKEHKSEKFFKEAELIAQACLDILSKGEVNVEELSENIVSIESDDDNEYKIFGSSNEKKGELSYKDDWKIGSSLLLNILGDSEDMYPFRQPVSREDYPDYYKEISTPICFEEINTKFYSNLYKSQKEVFEDIELIISNSYKFNQVEESAIFYATKGVEALFKELRKQINSKKESSRKNKSTPSLRKKQKNSNRKPNEETVVCQKEKEKECNTANIVAQQMDAKNIKSSKEDENTADETETDSKNQTSYLAVIQENKGKENKSTIKENVQKRDSIKRKRLHDEHNYNKGHKIKKNFTNVNGDEGKYRKVTKSCIKTGDFSQSQAHCTENKNQINSEPKSSQILQSQIQGSTDSFNPQVIHEGQEPPQSCNNIKDLTQSQNHSIQSRDKDVNDSSRKKPANVSKSLASVKANSMNINEDEEKYQIVTKSCIKTAADFTQLQAHCTESTNQINLEPKSSQILQSQIQGSTDLFNLQIIKEQEHQAPPKRSNKVGLTQLQNHSIDNRDKDVNVPSQEKSNVTKSLVSLKANSINMNDNEEKRQKVTKSNIKTRDFTQSQGHCTESTNQINLEPKSSQSLQSEIGGSIDSFNLQINKEEQEHREPLQGRNSVEDVTQSQNHRNRDKDVNNAPQKKANVKKSLASFKARKQMHLKYKRIFQQRPHKSCDLCQCIKRTYLAHLKSHHTFNTS